MVLPTFGKTHTARSFYGFLTELAKIDSDVETEEFLFKLEEYCKTPEEYDKEDRDDDFDPETTFFSGGTYKIQGESYFEYDYEVGPFLKRYNKKYPKNKIDPELFGHIQYIKFTTKFPFYDESLKGNEYYFFSVFLKDYFKKKDCDLNFQSSFYYNDPYFSKEYDFTSNIVVEVSVFLYEKNK